jgi:hypothetical protein
MMEDVSQVDFKGASSEGERLSNPMLLRPLTMSHVNLERFVVSGGDNDIFLNKERVYLINYMHFKKELFCIVHHL